MPLSINVGLARKASKDYQSAGTSINITAELDQALLARPQDLQQQIAGLYSQAEMALNRAAGERAAPETPATNGHTPQNGQRPPANQPRMTESQRRAIYAIAQRHQLDPQLECEDEFGSRLEELTVRQASGFIDHLKTLAGINGSPRKVGAR